MVIGDVPLGPFKVFTVAVGCPFFIKGLKKACVDTVPTLVFSKAGPGEASFTNPPILCYLEVRILPMNARPVLYVWGWDFLLERGGIPFQRLNDHLQESCSFLRSSTTANTFHKMSNMPMSKSEDSKRVQGKGTWWLKGINRNPFTSLCSRPGSGKK